MSAERGRRGAARERRGAKAGAAAEDESFGDGVARKAVRAVRAADRFAGGKEVRHAGAHVGVHADAAHVVVRDRRYFDRLTGEVDAVRREAVDHRTEGRAQDRKSTRLNSSHLVISYAVFCLKK